MIYGSYWPSLWAHFFQHWK